MSLSENEATALVDSVQTWRYSVDARQFGFFLAKKVSNLQKQGEKQAEFENQKQMLAELRNSGVMSEDQYESEMDRYNREELRPVTPGTPGVDLGFTWVIGSLAKYEQGFFHDVPAEDRFICFADPSNYTAHPGWMLRNLLVLVRQRWKLNRTQVLFYREVQARRHEAKSVICWLETDATEVSTQSSEMPRVTGWERSSSGKVASKIANLGEYMDPQR